MAIPSKSIFGFVSRHANGNLQRQKWIFMLNQEALTKFQEIWKQENGEELSDDLVVEEAMKLLTFFDAIYRPIKI
jgi:hypothetical protein